MEINQERYQFKHTRFNNQMIYLKGVKLLYQLIRLYIIRITIVKSKKINNQNQDF